MGLKESLIEYCKEEGHTRRWVAKKIGISTQIFYQVMQGNEPLPVKAWIKLIELTKGRITLGDIIGSKFMNIEEIEVRNGYNFDRCEISLRKINK